MKLLFSVNNILLNDIFFSVVEANSSRKAELFRSNCTIKCSIIQGNCMTISCTP